MFRKFCVILAAASIFSISFAGVGFGLSTTTSGNVYSVSLETTMAYIDVGIGDENLVSDTGEIDYATDVREFAISKSYYLVSLGFALPLDNCNVYVGYSFNYRTRVYDDIEYSDFTHGFDSGALIYGHISESAWIGLYVGYNSVVNQMRFGIRFGSD